MKRRNLLWVLPFLLGACAWAQYGGLRYTLVRADYGAGNVWRDVTGLVQGMVRSNQLSFQVSNAVLGGDPAPRAVKQLRLQLRDERGGTRIMNFGEGQTVNLAVASGSWGGWRGGGGGGLSITRAQYGSGSRMRDVTSLLNSQIQNGVLGMRVGNDTLGGDPAPGSVKTLTVWYVSGGRPGQITLNENAYLSLGSGGQGGGGGYPGQTLQILRAEYGAGDRLVDVTTVLNSQIRNGQLSLRITNDTMGRDPAEEHRKQLTVWYVYGGRTATITVPEKSVLTLPGGNPTYVANLLIMRAQYGADYRFRDVTSLLNARIQGNQLSLRITNDSMGGDPAPDRPKILTVSYVYNGQSGQVVVNERDTLNLPGAGTGGGWNWPGGGGQLQILQATFGAGNQNMDVTSRLAAQVQGVTLNMQVNRSTMGGDPAPGQTKRLKVIYLWQGLRYETNVPEGGTLDLP